MQSRQGSITSINNDSCLRGTDVVGKRTRCCRGECVHFWPLRLVNQRATVRYWQQALEVITVGVFSKFTVCYRGHSTASRPGCNSTQGQ
ncbi:hypothetical protein RRG08_001246 [Elysia crispata]|uniref:Uncharacterized protein n=1 Tax=Elysia crispata TaxID=231223 RepID=A0AAE1EB02_9GAST|nr:hypothetical protein RRG08_001246 [Elysia crispata]